MSDPGGPRDGADTAVVAPVAADLGLIPTVIAAALAGIALVLTARSGSVALMVAVSVVQAALAVAWLGSTRSAGRIGTFLIAVAAGAAAEATAAVWPHGHLGNLGTLVAIFGLAVPAMFAHQLSRGTGRVHVVASLGSTAMVVGCEVALPSLSLLWHQFHGPHVGGELVGACAGAICVALVAGALVDRVLPVPRFDADVPHGLAAVVVGTVLAALVSYSLVRGLPADGAFGGGRAAFTGAVLGALAGLIGIAGTFVMHSLPLTTSAPQRVARGILAALFPLSVVAPAALLLCLALHS